MFDYGGRNWGRGAESTVFLYETILNNKTRDIYVLQISFIHKT